MKKPVIIRYLLLRYWTKRLLAIVLLILLPVVAFASALAAFDVIGDTTEELARGVSDKNIAYWFVSLAGVAITSWTFVGKWLFGQLDQQRAAHQAVTVQLIGYMEKDHTLMIETVTQLRDVMKQFVASIEPRRFPPREPPDVDDRIPMRH